MIWGLDSSTNHSLYHLLEIPDEAQNGGAPDYTDEYEDDFNPTRYLQSKLQLLQKRQEQCKVSKSVR